MKFLTIGDPHFKVDNLSEVNDFIRQTEKALQSIENLDFIVCLGDLLHTHARINSMPMNEAYKFIEVLSKYAQTFVLVGNHDMINNSQFLSDCHWMNGMKKWNNVTIVDAGYVSEKWNCTFVPYVPPGRFVEALNIIDEKEWEKRSFIFAHQEFKGAKMGAILSEIGDEWKEEYPQVISGHIHDKHKPQKNVFYVGSAMQHAFGECPRKALHLFTVESENECKEEEVELNLVERKIIYLSSEDLENAIEKMIDDGKLQVNDEKKKYKLTISGNIAEYKMYQKSEHYASLQRKGVKFVFKYDRKSGEEEEKKCQIMSFKDTLLGLIKKEKNKSLYSLTNSLLED